MAVYIAPVPEQGHKHSLHSGTSARMGTSAEMGVKVIQGSLSSSGTGHPVPELGSSHDPVPELGFIFGPNWDKFTQFWNGDVSPSQFHARLGPNIYMSVCGTINE